MFIETFLKVCIFRKIILLTLIVNGGLVRVFEIALFVILPWMLVISLWSIEQVVDREESPGLNLILEL